MRTLTVGAIVADRSSDELRTVFVAFVGGLENDTLYAVSVKAADSQGRANRRSSTFRTLRPQTIADGSGIGDLAAGAGCAAQCIRTAQMEAGLRAAKIMSVRQGTFETAKRHVAVTFKRIRVSYDGDKGRNRGELSFFAKINGHWRLERGEGKVKSNSTVHFPNGGTVGYTDLTRWIDIKVQAVERDSKGTCYDSLGPGPFSQSLSGSNKKRCHKRTWNTAPGQFDLDEIFAQDALLPGFGGWSSFDKTIYADRGPIRFQVDLGFEVWSE